MKKWIWLAFLLGGSVQAARVVLDTRLSPQPTYVSDTRRTQVLRDAYAPKGVPGCRDARVTDETPGAFTRAGSQQTAYLIHACGSSKLVIYQGGHIVRTLNNVGDAIGNIGDINGDGTDDLLFLAKFYGRGSNTVQDASLVTLAGGKFRTLYDLPQAAVDECSSADAYTGAFRVTVQPGPHALLTLNAYRGDCVAGMRLVETRTARINP